MIHSLGVHELQVAYETEQLRPTQVIEAVLARIAARGDDAVWISRWPDHELRRQAADLDRVGRDRGIAGMPLFGVPCAVKDNIDVAGLATIAGCPGFATGLTANAGCAQRLVDAGQTADGRPASVTLIGPAFSERLLLSIATRLTDP